MSGSVVFVTGRGVVSPAGVGPEAQWQALLRGMPRTIWDDVLGPVGRLGPEGEAALAELMRDKRWRAYDRAALLGVLAARAAWQEAGSPAAGDLAVIFGSSRGATATLEREHDRFLATGKTGVQTSPMTTPGVFAAAVSQALAAGGPSLAVSSACATGLNAVGVAMALLQSGQARHAVAGGAEASLTPFTLAQLQATSVLAKKPSALYPCRPLHPDRSGLVPGEGSACVLLSVEKPAAGAPWASLLGFGAAAEPATATGISPDGRALVLAVERALAHAGLMPRDIDLVVGHGAGTQRGDAAELAAYRAVFGAELPPLTFHKWLTGHMIGASPAFSLILAGLHLETGEVPELPYYEVGMAAGQAMRLPAKARHALVTALGFGGNASAVVVAKT